MTILLGAVLVVTVVALTMWWMYALYTEPFQEHNSDIAKRASVGADAGGSVTAVQRVSDEK